MQDDGEEKDERKGNDCHQGENSVFVFENQMGNTLVRFFLERERNKEERKERKTPTQRGG